MLKLKTLGAFGMLMIFAVVGSAYGQTADDPTVTQFVGQFEDETFQHPGDILSIDFYADYVAAKGDYIFVKVEWRDEDGNLIKGNTEGSATAVNDPESPVERITGDSLIQVTDDHGAFVTATVSIYHLDFSTNMYGDEVLICDNPTTVTFERGGIGDGDLQPQSAPPAGVF